MPDPLVEIRDIAVYGTPGGGPCRLVDTMHARCRLRICRLELVWTVGRRDHLGPAPGSPGIRGTLPAERRLLRRCFTLDDIAGVEDIDVVARDVVGALTIVARSGVGGVERGRALLLTSWFDRGTSRRDVDLWRVARRLHDAVEGRPRP